jgi:hypothetical protein
LPESNRLFSQHVGDMVAQEWVGGEERWRSALSYNSTAYNTRLASLRDSAK